MKVILTEKVPSLGNIGEIVNVSAGHARNFLIPNKFAVLADEKNTLLMEDQKRRLAKKIEDQKKEALALKKKIDGLTLELVKKVGGSGRLFGTVTSVELAQLLKEKGVEVERRQIQVDTPIKQLGTFDVTVKVFSGVEAKFKVKVVMDAEQAEEFKRKQEEALQRAKKRKEEKASQAESEAAGEAVEAKGEEA